MSSISGSGFVDSDDSEYESKFNSSSSVKAHSASRIETVTTTIAAETLNAMLANDVPSDPPGLAHQK